MLWDLDEYWLEPETRVYVVVRYLVTVNEAKAGMFIASVHHAAAITNELEAQRAPHYFIDCSRRTLLLQCPNAILTVCTPCQVEHSDAQWRNLISGISANNEAKVSKKSIDRFRTLQAHRYNLRADGQLLTKI